MGLFQAAQAGLVLVLADQAVDLAAGHQVSVASEPLAFAVGVLLAFVAEGLQVFVAEVLLASAVVVLLAFAVAALLAFAVEGLLASVAEELLAFAVEAHQAFVAVGLLAFDLAERVLLGAVVVELRAFDLVAGVELLAFAVVVLLAGLALVADLVVVLQVVAAAEVLLVSGHLVVGLQVFDPVAEAVLQASGLVAAALGHLAFAAVVVLVVQVFVAGLVEVLRVLVAAGVHPVFAGGPQALLVEALGLQVLAVVLLVVLEVLRVSVLAVGVVLLAFVLVEDQAGPVWARRGVLVGQALVRQGRLAPLLEEEVILEIWDPLLPLVTLDLLAVVT